MIETNDISGLVTIQSLVSDVLGNDTTEDIMIDILKIAIRGAKQLNMFYLDEPKVYIGEVSPLNQMSLPPDFVDMSIIAYIANGEAKIVSRNDRIRFTLLEADGLESVLQENLDEIRVPSVKHYSLPAGYSILSARVRQRYNRIEFKGNAQGTPIYLEYVSTGVGVKTFIPALAQETMIAWIEWKLAEKIKEPIYERQHRERIYDKELTKFMTFKKRLPPVEEFIRQFNTTRKQTVKG